MRYTHTMAKPTMKMICPNPNCTYKGHPLKMPKGSALTGLFLMLFGLLPGIIYFIAYGGHNFYCPECTLQTPEQFPYHAIANLPPREPDV